MRLKGFRSSGLRVSGLGCGVIGIWGLKVCRFKVLGFKADLDRPNVPKQGPIVLSSYGGYIHVYIGFATGRIGGPLSSFGCHITRSGFWTLAYNASLTGVRLLAF